MNKTTNQIETQGYVTPEVKVYAIKVKASFLSAGAPDLQSDDVENDTNSWSF